MPKKYTVDRFEGDLAVLLLRNGETVQKDVPREQLPDDVQEGDILEVQFSADGKVLDVKVLTEETESARKKAEDLLQKILDKNKEF